MKTKVKNILASKIDGTLIEPLLEAYFDLKEHFYLGKHRPSELEGGRFCEVVIRCLQNLGNGSYTGLNTKLKRFDQEIKDLERAGGGKAHDSIRIHIPKVLLGVYGIRNRRNVGHVNGDVNPNFSDATLVMGICDWTLAEIIRLIYNCPLEQAQTIVDGLVERKVPLIQEFDGFLKILNPSLSTPDKILAILYFKDKKGAEIGEIDLWLKCEKQGTIRKALQRLENEKAYIHRSGNKCWITGRGLKYSEEKIPFSF